MYCLKSRERKEMQFFAILASPEVASVCPAAWARCLSSLGRISRARILMFFLASFARIRRLRKSPQHLLAILQWKNDSLRNSPQNFHKIVQTNIKNPGSRKFPISGHSPVCSSAAAPNAAPKRSCVAQTRAAWQPRNSMVWYGIV